MNLHLQNIRQNFQAVSSPAEKQAQVEALLNQLNVEKTITVAQTTLLLYMMVDLCSKTRVVNPQLEQKLNNLFLNKKLSSNAIKLFTDEWFKPFGQNFSDKEIKAAYKKIGGDTKDLNLNDIRKLFALASSQRELSHEERMGLLSIKDNASMSPELQEKFEAALLNKFIDTLLNIQANTPLDEVKIQDLLDTIATNPANKELKVIAEELYWRNDVPTEKIELMAQALSNKQHLRQSEWSIVKKMLANASGELDDNAIRKITARLNQYPQLNRTEKHLIKELESGEGVNDAGTQVFKRWQVLQNPQKTNKYVENRFSRLYEKLLPDLSKDMIVQAIQSLPALDDRSLLVDSLKIVKSLASMVPMTEDQQQRITKVTTEYIDTLKSSKADKTQLPSQLKENLENILNLKQFPQSIELLSSGVTPTYTKPVASALKQVQSIASDGKKAVIFGSTSANKKDLSSYGFFYNNLSTGELKPLAFEGIKTADPRSIQMSMNEDKLVVCYTGIKPLNDGSNKGLPLTKTFSYDLKTNEVEDIAYPDLDLIIHAIPKVNQQDGSLIMYGQNLQSKKDLFFKFEQGQWQELPPCTKHYEDPIIAYDIQKGLAITNFTQEGKVDIELYNQQEGSSRLLPPCQLQSAFLPISMKFDGNNLHVVSINPEARMTDVHTIDLSSEPAKWTKSSTAKNCMTFNDETLFYYDKDFKLYRDFEIPTKEILKLQERKPEFKAEGRHIQPKNLLAQKTRLSQKAIESIESQDVVTKKDIVALLKVAQQADIDGVLDDNMKVRISKLFYQENLEPQAVNAYDREWMQSGMSTEQPGLFAKLVKEFSATLPLSRSNTLRLLSAARLEENPEQTILASPLANMAAEVDKPIIAQRLYELLEARAGNLLKQNKMNTKDTETFVGLATTIKGEYPDLTLRLNRLMKLTLLLGNHVDDTGDLFRPYFEDSISYTSMEARLAIANFAKKNGRLNLPALRAIATLLDADGNRSSIDNSIVERLLTYQTRSSARKVLERMSQGVTTPADLEGVESGNGKIDGSGSLIVWKNENRFASNSKVIKVGIERPYEAASDGIHAPGIHVSGKNIVDRVEGQEPGVNEQYKMLTRDEFDQVQLLWGGDFLLNNLESFGVDVEKLQSHSYANDGVIRYKANDFSDLNAYYSPSRNYICFGTAKDKWHLASDLDVAIHESGHYTLDHIQPNMTSGREGGAIHEGFADGLASCLFNDAEMSEDFGVFFMQEGQGNGIDPDNPFLRNVDNDYTLSSVDSEVHARGQVYGGYIWSVKKWLEENGLAGEDAAQKTAELAVMHAYFYTSSYVKPEMFVQGMLSAAKEVFANSPLLTPLSNFLLEEGIKREMVKRNDQNQSLTYNLPLPMQAHTLGIAGQSAVKTYLKQFIPENLSKNIKFELVSEQSCKKIKKSVYKAVLKDPKSGKLLPIEDGYVGCLQRNSQLFHVNGGGLKLPASIDLSPSQKSEQDMVDQALPLIKQFFNNDAAGNKYTQEYVLNNFDTIFDKKSIKTNWVINNGQLALKLSSPAGEFIVDKNVNTVKPQLLMQIG